MLTGALIGAVVAIVMMVVYAARARKGGGLSADIARVLAERPMTLKEISVAVGKDSFMGRGTVVQWLAGMQQAKKVRVIPAPNGTPQLKKVDFIKYELVTPATPPSDS